MRQSVCVNIPKLGAFCFQLSYLKHGQAQHQDLVYKKSFFGFSAEQSLLKHELRPCFIPDRLLRQHLRSTSTVDELGVSPGLTSIYQQGFQTQVCNFTDVAFKCHLPKKLVESCIGAFIKAIYDLVCQSKSICLDFGFCRVSISNQQLKYTFTNAFIS